MFDVIAHTKASLHLTLGRRVKGVLRLGLAYEESMAALLATDANPPPREVPSFSIERSAKEWQRFVRCCRGRWRGGRRFDERWRRGSCGSWLGRGRLRRTCAMC
jgi:hypothetical protein